MYRLSLLVVLLLGLTRTAGAQTDDDLLALYKGLRVADVVDGMDVVGLRGIGILDTRIEALWKDIDELDHQFTGIAVTARYVPTNRVVPNPLPPDEFDRWSGNWYGQISSEPFVDSLREGSVMVIDASGSGDTGSIGSYNALAWFARGMRGIVTSGSVRDTDEVIKQQIPVYLDHMQRGRGIRPGRNEIESVNEPVVVGGVLIYPGDVVVADGDGVVVVPRAHAAAVAEHARKVLDADKAGRRSLYEQLGIPLDKTVR